MKITAFNARLVALNAALAEQLDWSTKQLGLYLSPNDTATRRIIAEGQSLIRESKKLTPPLHEQPRK